MYIHQSIFGRRRDTFAQSWCKKKGLSLMGTQLKRPQTRSTFFGSTKMGVGICDSRLYFWEWCAMGQQHCSACGPSKAGLM